jgi:fructose-bisphosphate aldolase class II
MPIVSMRQLLDHAAENGYGIPAFNVNNLEQVQAVMAAADEVGAPVILQASAGARKYAGEAFIKHLIQAAVEAYPNIPLVMHQDHGQSPAICQGAINLGFGSVMMDGSLREDGKTPASFDYNVEVTRKVVDMAHAVGVTVEGELGCLGNLETGDAGEEDGIGAEGKLDHSQMLTDPEEAAVFVKATQLDALAIAIGTSHGAYKFSRKPTGDILAISRVKEIHTRIPNTHLVMHGSSSVPQDLLDIINQYGGKMKQTYGVPVEEIQEAIKHGVRKINIDTDIRMAMTGAVRKFLAENPDKFDAREWLKPAREAAKARSASSATWSSAARARPARSRPSRWRHGAPLFSRRAGAEGAVRLLRPVRPPSGLAVPRRSTRSAIGSIAWFCGPRSAIFSAPSGCPARHSAPASSHVPARRAARRGRRRRSPWGPPRGGIHAGHMQAFALHPQFAALFGQRDHHAVDVGAAADVGGLFAGALFQHAGFVVVHGHPAWPG